MSRFEQAVGRFEAAHEEDPRAAEVDGETLPWAVHYHRRMAAWQEKLAPEASEALRLACRCQHIYRWKLPRSEYPEGRVGYKRWRSELARRHAEDAAAILRDVGYDAQTIERVGDLLRKKGLRRDAEVQTFEDIICLVFIENQLADFAADYPHEKVVDVLQKTWRKMSPAGHEAALGLVDGLPEETARLVREALA